MSVGRPSFAISALGFLVHLQAAAVCEESRDVEPRYEIELEFEGNDTLAAPDLRQALSALLYDLRRSGVDESALDDAKYLLERYYKSKGFPAVEIEPRREVEGEDRFVLGFLVQEGYRTFLEDLKISGNRHFAEAELVDCFQWERHTMVGELLGLGKRVYTPDAVKEGIDCLRGQYRFQGFSFVEIRHEVDDSDAEKIRVKIEIQEGPQVMLRLPVAIEGLEAISEDEVRAALNVTEELPFDPRLPLIFKGRILDLYLTRGYPRARVQVERDVNRENASATLTFKVSEGPVTRIRDIEIRGNERSWERVVRRYMRIEAGALYDEEKIRESHRNLIRSGLFEAVSIEREDIDGTPDEVSLKVTVKEKPRYSISALVGYGSWERLRGALVVEDRNIFGSGHRLRGEARGSFKNERFSLEYLNPYFFDQRMSQDASGFYERRERRTFESQEFGGRVGLRYRPTAHTNTRFFYELKQSELLEINPGIPPELVEDVRLGSLNLTGGFDNRQNFLDPIRGVNLRASLAYAGGVLGSDLDFLRSTVSATGVLPLPWKLRLVVNGSTGVIGRLADTDAIPIQERFFLGGENTIRSFREDKAGPAVGGAPIGGESFLLFNTELRFPLLLLEDLDGVIFGDVGTVNGELDQYGGGRYFFAVGTGLRYSTPIGPLRVDFAFNPDREGGEDFFVFHFGLGYPF